MSDYLKEARKDNHIPNEEVAIDRFNHLFHSKDKLKTLHDTTEDNLDSAVEGRIVPCSKCYPTLKTYRDTEKQLELQRL